MGASSLILSLSLSLSLSRCNNSCCQWSSHCHSPHSLTLPAGDVSQPLLLSLTHSLFLSFSPSLTWFNFHYTDPNSTEMWILELVSIFCHSLPISDIQTHRMYSGIQCVFIIPYFLSSSLSPFFPFSYQLPFHQTQLWCESISRHSLS